jgi:hypothetical protein
MVSHQLRMAGMAEGPQGSSKLRAVRLSEREAWLWLRWRGRLCAVVCAVYALRRRPGYICSIPGRLDNGLAAVRSSNDTSSFSELSHRYH